MTAATAYVSFLIRLWREEGERIGELAADWRSHIEHIQSGKHWSFDTLDELLDFLRHQAQDPNILLQSDQGSRDTNKGDY